VPTDVRYVGETVPGDAFVVGYGLHVGERYRNLPFVAEYLPGDPGVITSASNSPDTTGWIAEAIYVPWLNTKLSLQYTAYSKFNGGGTNYDGVGRNASGNNTWYALIWFAY